MKLFVSLRKLISYSFFVPDVGRLQKQKYKSIKYQQKYGTIIRFFCIVISIFSGV